MAVFNNHDNVGNISYSDVVRYVMWDILILSFSIKFFGIKARRHIWKVEEVMQKNPEFE